MKTALYFIFEFPCQPSSLCLSVRREQELYNGHPKGPKGVRSTVLLLGVGYLAVFGHFGDPYCEYAIANSEFG